MDLQEPERKMSTTGGGEAGTVYVLDEPEAIRKKLGSAVTDSGREIVPRRGQGRDRQPDRHPRRSPGESIRAAVRGEFAGRRLRRLQGGCRCGGWSSCSLPCRERYARAASRRAALEESFAAGREGAGDRRSPPPEVRDRMGIGLALTWSVTVAELDLDLDVFAGPFDLLMAVVLREEVSLLEVELAEVVVAYCRAPRARGELELDVATEFLVLIARCSS
jgi:hypothetical protein